MFPSEVLSNELYARTIFAVLGLVCGAVPFIFAYMHRQFLLGAVNLVCCAAIAAAGLPYLSPVLAGLFFYLIYRVVKKKKEKEREQNRKNYQKNLKAQNEGVRAAENQVIENKRVANAAWPPVDQVIDREALKDFERLVQNDSDE